jgi:hypothetical protein
MHIMLSKKIMLRPLIKTINTNRTRCPAQASSLPANNKVMRQFLTSSPQDFFHHLSLGQLVDKLVQITNLLNDRILDFFHPIATYHSSDL